MMNSNRTPARSIRLRNVVIAAALILILTLAGCAGNGAVTPEKTQTPEETQATEDTPAESPDATEPEADPLFGDFKAQDTEGNEVTNDIFAGCDVTMVNIWATFCGPCVNEMPELAELNEEYGDRSFQIVGIVVDAADQTGDVDEDTLADALDIIQSTGANYTHIVPSAAMFGAYLKNVSSVPTTVFVNSKGEIIGTAYVGSRTKADWAKIIEEKLG